jgi:hypothetical protein
MSGSDKLFYHLEPYILKNLSKVNSRDISHIVYAYSIRSVGNPELYKAFDKRIEDIIDKEGRDCFNHPTIFNMLYYLMFT